MKLTLASYCENLGIEKGTLDVNFLPILETHYQIFKELLDITTIGYHNKSKNKLILKDSLKNLMFSLATFYKYVEVPKENDTTHDLASQTKYEATLKESLIGITYNLEQMLVWLKLSEPTDTDIHLNIDCCILYMKKVCVCLNTTLLEIITEVKESQSNSPIPSK